MNEIILKTPTGEKTFATSNAVLTNQQPELVTIQGTLTKSLSVRDNHTEPYYYSFLKLPDQLTDLPIIFKEKPAITLNSVIELTGYYHNSPPNIRKSFTCTTYQVLSSSSPPTIPKIKHWKTYQVRGIITAKELILKKRPFYRLSVALEDDPTSLIKAFADKLTNPTIWKVLQNQEFSNQRYLFKYLNYMGQYHLIDWEEIKSYE